MARQLTLLRVFVAAPDDVKPEVGAVADVIDELNVVLAHQALRLETRSPS